MSFNLTLRNQTLQQNLNDFDLLVIGGGVTGCGIALDAALRGLKTILIEKNDFASGTSSRSTKLIHGGLRYLKQLEFKLVKDVGRERAIVYRNAMHIVRPEKMLLPIVKGGSLGKQSSSLGLLVYDILAGVKSSERRKMLSKEKTISSEPLLGTENLLAGGLYYEYRTDDARLVIELAKSANEQGAKLLNYCSADNFIYDENGKVKGVAATDLINQQKVEIYAKTIVNACGPSVDILRKADQSLFGKRLQLTKGVHLVFPYAKVPLKQSAYFDVSDGRMIFAIPRDGITYIGTTDTVYNQDIDHPRISQDDVTYILNAVNNMFPTLNLQKSDVQSGWAGLRPLIYEDGKSPSELSRKDEIIISESGLVSIAGGKLTGYRLMAEKIATIAQANTTHVIQKRSTTDVFKLAGCAFSSEESMREAIKKLAASSGIAETQISKWFYKYGSNTQVVIDNYLQMVQKNEQAVAVLLSELLYGIEHEMVCSVCDFAVRRSGMLFFNIPDLIQYQNELVQFMQQYFAWNEEKTQAEKEALRMAIEEATVFI